MDTKSKREMIKRLIDYYSNGKQNAFAEKIKVKPQTINSWISRGTFDIERIYAYCEDISADWLLTGLGSITKGGSNQAEDSEEHRYVAMDDKTHYSKVAELLAQDPDPKHNVNYYNVAVVENPPIIPSILSRKPGIDLMEVVRNSTEGMEICPIQVDGAVISLWYRVDDESLYPEYRINDKIALRAYPKAFERPIPGVLYGVDTYPYGLLIRKLFPHEDGYIARAVNVEEFPDMLLRQDDIVRLFRIVLQVRMK